MEPFVYQPLPTRVLFGRGAVTRIKDEAERLGVKRALGGAARRWRSKSRAFSVSAPPESMRAP
jgi:hypothetical protein